MRIELELNEGDHFELLPVTKETFILRVRRDLTTVISLVCSEEQITWLKEQLTL